ncbi:MAG: hypothetical protein ACUVQD_05255 [Thermaceae bacterium]
MHRQVLNTLTPYLGKRAEALLQEGAVRLGKKLEDLSPEDLQTLLKGPVYRELQGRLPKGEARKVVEELLKELSPPDLGPLEAGLKRFGLYLDWPEVGRLRALYRRLQERFDQGLYREALNLLEELKEKLEEALLRQREEIAHLEEAFSRVRHLGGPKVRRLEALISTIKEAQAQEVLAQAEVERARQLALELRKLSESSALRLLDLSPKQGETPPSSPEDHPITVEDFSEEELIIDLDALPEEERQHLRALELEEEKHRLERLKERYAHVLDRVDLAQAEALLEKGTPLGEKLSKLEEELQRAEEGKRAETLAQLILLEERARNLGGEVLEEVRLAQATLQEGGWPDLEALTRKLEAKEAERRRILELEKEREALLEELQRDPSFSDLLEEVRSLPQERLNELPNLKERYLARLREKDARAHLLALAQAVLPGEDLEGLSLEDLKARLLTSLEQRLAELKAKAEALGIELDLKEAEAALAEGRPFDPRPLEHALEVVLSQRRLLALEELSRLEALAQRYRGLGGEAVLERIQEERAKPLPSVLPIRQALSALARKQEAIRAGLRTRLLAFFQTYEPLRTLEGETARRLRPMAEVLKTALDRLDRLGPGGLLKTEAILTEAEPLLSALKKEEEAAKSVLRALKSEDLESLLKTLETPTSPKGDGLDLAPLRIPGVETLDTLDNLPVLRPLAEAWARLDEIKGPGKALVVYWGREALVLLRIRERLIGALMDRHVVSHFLMEAERLH